MFRLLHAAIQGCHCNPAVVYDAGALVFILASTNISDFETNANIDDINGTLTLMVFQYTNEPGLSQPDFACFEHSGGSRSNTKAGYVILVCQKPCIPTDIARLRVHSFRAAGTQQYICTTCVFLMYERVCVLYTHELIHAYV